MKILDLFSGLGGWAGAFRARGHEVVTLDLDPRFGCTVTADILTVTAADLAKYGPFDGILASPPCESFSVAAFGHHWLPNRVPRTDGARTGMRIVEHTLGLIGALRPRWWLLENPRGMLRKLPMMTPYRRWTVTFCQHGDTRMKPTDL